MRTAPGASQRDRRATSSASPPEGGFRHRRAKETVMTHLDQVLVRSHMQELWADADAYARARRLRAARKWAMRAERAARRAARASAAVR